MSDKRSQTSGIDRQSTTDEPSRRPLSMHENVPDWCDCCSCEAEPGWQALEEELERERATDES